MVAPVEQLVAPEVRERVRTAWLAEAGWYSPWLHLGITSFFGLGVMAVAAPRIGAPTAVHVAFAVATWVLLNAAEWRIHRDLLHRRSRFAPVLYDRHTPQHHMVFVTDDMAMRSTGEFRLVLIPAYGIVLAFVSAAPIPAALWLGLGRPDLAAVFAFVTMGYVVSYEWLHLAYHLPEGSFVGSRRTVAWLRHHHAVHHDPRLMQRWNFNVTVPLWDLVRRTRVRSYDHARSMEKDG